MGFGAVAQALMTAGADKTVDHHASLGGFIDQTKDELLKRHQKVAPNWDEPETVNKEFVALQGHCCLALEVSRDKFPPLDGTDDPTGDGAQQPKKPVKKLGAGRWAKLRASVTKERLEEEKPKEHSVTVFSNFDADMVEATHIAQNMARAKDILTADPNRVKKALQIDELMAQKKIGFSDLKRIVELVSRLASSLEKLVEEERVEKMGLFYKEGLMFDGDSGDPASSDVDADGNPKALEADEETARKRVGKNGWSYFIPTQTNVQFPSLRFSVAVK